MPYDNTTRRSMLRRMTGGVVGIAGLSGFVSGQSTGQSERHIVGAATADARQAAERAADSVHRVLEFGRIGSAVAGVYPDGRLDALRRRSDVRYVEVDGMMHAIGRESYTQAPGGNPGPPGGGGGGGDTTETLSWGIDRVDADVAHTNGETGNGADIAIIDTGIDDDHPDLQTNVDAGKAYVKCRGRNCNYPWSDDNDHGSHCAGIADAVDNTEGVIGVSTEATLHAVKVLDKSGSGSFSDVAAGVEYTADQGWDVGSMSLGASSGSQTVKDACRYAYDNGVLLVAAAGNSGPCSDCVGYPAAYPTVIAVSSTTETDSLSGFSSTGPEVELAAPGSNIYSTVIGSYDTFSGTSMACPHVAGTGGQLMANGSSNTTARDRLRSTAESIGLSENESGYGLLDTAAALGLDSSEST
jgi:subtilisin